MQFQQNMTATIQDLKMQIGQLANTSAGSSNLPSQTIPNPRGNASAMTLRSGKELPQPTLQQLLGPTKADSEPNVDLQSRLERAISLPFPSRTISARKPESDEELLKMFRKVEINIPLLDAIKQVPKYAKFLKELCEAFERIKQNLQKPPVLIPLVLGRPFIMYLSMGCVLGQHDDSSRKEHVIYYLSKNFTNCKMRYSSLERTCYALA
ncbi:hypothetical protein CR513_28436, partial [Mucuna pruriens]